MKKILFKGVGTALYTPITDGKIDFKAYELLIDEQISAGVSALIFLGTTGESATIDDDERKEIVKFAVDYVSKRVPVIIGCGSNSTAKARKFTEQAKEYNADGALCVTPYYNKCTQYGLIKHYEEINKSSIPIIIYNVPSRTGLNALPETENDIADIEYVCGIKEANSDKRHIKKLFNLVNGKVAIYSGNDSLNTFFYARKGIGTISVASNIIPDKIVEQFNDFTTFYDRHNFKNYKTINELTDALFVEVNPIPLKAMLEILGKDGTELRLPLTRATDDHYEYFIKLLHKLEL